MFNPCGSYTTPFSFRTGEAIILSGIQDDDLITRFGVYPNPLSKGSNLKLIVNSNKAMKTHVSIFDLNGKQVSNLELHLNTGDQQYDIDLENLSSGMYMLGLNTGEKIFTDKFLISR